MVTAYGEATQNRVSVHRGALPGSGRRPKTRDGRRVCREDECGTVLSRYNLGDLCRLHTPVVFPRIRGNVIDDTESGFSP